MCPESAHYIVPFIKIHRHDILELIDSFSMCIPLTSSVSEYWHYVTENFTELFHRLAALHSYYLLLLTISRKLKPSPRPVKLSDDWVSCADCRLMTFIYKWCHAILNKIPSVCCGAVTWWCIQVSDAAILQWCFCYFLTDFQSPVDGTIGPMTSILGEHYMMNVSCTPSCVWLSVLPFPLGSPVPKNLLDVQVSSRGITLHPKELPTPLIQLLHGLDIWWCWAKRDIILIARNLFAVFGQSWAFTVWVENPQTTT